MQRPAALPRSDPTGLVAAAAWLCSRVGGNRGHSHEAVAAAAIAAGDRGHGHGHGREDQIGPPEANAVRRRRAGGGGGGGAGGGG